MIKFQKLKSFVNLNFKYSNLFRISNLGFRISPNRSGFTIVEILVVISIIGLLSATILVGLSGLRAKGRDSRRISDLKQVQTGLELFFSARGRYPEPSSWTGLGEQLRDATIGVNKIAHDPQFDGEDSTDYLYGVSSDGRAYMVAASMEEGEGEGSSAMKDSFTLEDLPEELQSDFGDFEDCGRTLYCQSL